MAKNFKLSNAAANAGVDAIAALLDGGVVKIYTGTQPASPETAVTDQTLLAVLGLGSPAFGATVNGVATAEAITEEDAALATGTAAWFRAEDSEGNPVLDGSVGTSDADMVLPTTSIVEYAEVHIDSWTLTLPKQKSS